jgi:hypothetical protein
MLTPSTPNYDKTSPVRNRTLEKEKLFTATANDNTEKSHKAGKFEKYKVKDKRQNYHKTQSKSRETKNNNARFKNTATIIKTEKGAQMQSYTHARNIEKNQNTHTMINNECIDLTCEKKNLDYDLVYNEEIKSYDLNKLREKKGKK